MPKKDTYDFPVSLQDIFVDNPNIEVGKFNKVEKRKAIMRLDTGEVLGIASDKYQLLPHKEVVKGFRKALQTYEFQETIKLSKNGAKMFVIYRLPEIKVKVRDNDPLNLQFIVKNSYDGTNALQIVFGAFRLVCENGMVIGQKFLSFSQKHIGSVELDVKQLRERVGTLTGQFKETIPLIERMADVRMGSADEAFGIDTKELVAEGLPEYLVKEARAEYERAGDDSVWGWYNSMTWAITHKMRKDNPQLSLNYGKVAWELAKDQMMA